MQPIAVYDTNILLSRLGWKGTPYQRTYLLRTASAIATENYTLTH